MRVRHGHRPRDIRFPVEVADRVKVLITTSYYWPEGAGSAPYLTGLAEHLSSVGHDVVVATGFAHYPDWRSSAKGRLAASETRNGVRIRRRWHYVPGAQSASHRAGTSCPSSPPGSPPFLAAGVQMSW